MSTIGGTPRLGVPETLSVAWSRDGTRLAHHGGVGGDPIFVADRNGANPRQIFVDKAGRHNHYLAWSPDGRFIYFVRGIMDPWDMDIWRIPSQGGTAERMTNHHSRVADPTLLDERTLLYTAARPDASGSGLYVMDIERRIPHAVSFGLEEYTSIAASADGRRLVATVANPTSHIWSAPISDRVADEAAVTRVLLPAVRARTPRFGPDYFLFLSYKRGGERLWKFQNDSTSELWRDGGPVVGAPAVSRDGSRICFVVREGGQNRLYVMSADGTGARRISDTLDARDAASWSPDGKWISVAAAEGEEQPLFKVPVDGGPAVRLAGGVNLNPVWSPDGRFIVYSVHHVGPEYQLKAITPEKEPFPIPEILVRYVGNRYQFLPDGKSLVLMLGELRHQDFWLLDFATGNRRQLTSLRPGHDMQNFDVSPDGKTDPVRSLSRELGRRPDRPAAALSYCGARNRTIVPFGPDRPAGLLVGKRDGVQGCRVELAPRGPAVVGDRGAGRTDGEKARGHSGHRDDRGEETGGRDGGRAPGAAAVFAARAVERGERGFLVVAPDGEPGLRVAECDREQARRGIARGNRIGRGAPGLPAVEGAEHPRHAGPAGHEPALIAALQHGETRPARGESALARKGLRDRCRAAASPTSARRRPSHG